MKKDKPNYEEELKEEIVKDLIEDLKHVMSYRKIAGHFYYILTNRRTSDFEYFIRKAISRARIRRNDKKEELGGEGK